MRVRRDQGSPPNPRRRRRRCAGLLRELDDLSSVQHWSTAAPQPPPALRLRQPSRQRSEERRVGVRACELPASARSSLSWCWCWCGARDEDHSDSGGALEPRFDAVPVSNWQRRHSATAHYSEHQQRQLQPTKERAAQNDDDRLVASRSPSGTDWHCCWLLHLPVLVLLSARRHAVPLRRSIAPAAVALGSSGKQAGTQPRSLSLVPISSGVCRRTLVSPRPPPTYINGCYTFNVTLRAFSPSAYASPISPLQPVTIYCAHTPQPALRPPLIRRVTLQVAVLPEFSRVRNTLLESLVHRLAVAPPSQRPTLCLLIGRRRR